MTGTEQYNAAAWLLDRHVDEGRGDRLAIRCEGRSTTYTELQHAVWRAQALLSELGAGPGDRVAMVVRDDEMFPAVFLGAMRSGLVPVPLSTMLHGGALGDIIADSGSRILFISDQFAGTLPDLLNAAPAIEHVVLSGEAEVDCACAVHRWAEAPVAAPQAVAPTTRSSQALWLYSSGTTGVPKGVMHVHGSLEATAATYAESVLAIGPDDRFLSVAKLFFAFGLGNSLTFPFAVGATAILHPDPPVPNVLVELIKSEGATLFFAPPGFCAATIDAAPARDAFASVRATVTAGESLPAPIHRAFTELTGAPVLDGIGSTEILHIFISNTPEDQVEGSSGRVVVGYEAELRSDAGDVVTEPGTPGYLHVRGPSTSIGYHDRPDATSAAFLADGWVRTGDVYVRSADDHWTFLGRNSDMIKAGGIWVSPAEVESVLIEHETVMEAAVVGGRDDAGLETVIAYVIPASGGSIDTELLLSHCRQRMATFKRPREIHVVDELPKTATGKIKRFMLRTETEH